MSYELKRADVGIKGFLNSVFMSSSERINKMSRGILEYEPNYVDAFFDPQLGTYNVIVSGGDSVYRNRAVCAQVSSAFQNNLPVIVLHEGNRYLEQSLRNNFSTTGKFVEVNQGCPCFEPMYSLNQTEISNQIIQSTPKSYDLKFNVKYYLDGLSTLMLKLGKRLSFKMFSTCPHAVIFDKVDDAQIQGKITDQEAQTIKSKLMMGQSENFKLESILENFQMEIDPIMWKSKTGFKPVNVSSAIKENKILCLDIFSVSNTILMNVLIYQMKLALTKGYSFVLVLDSLSVNSNEQYMSFMKTFSNKVAYTIVSEDVYTMVGGDDKLFDLFVGNSQLSIILSHAAGNSAKKWADVIGQYDAWVDTYSKSNGSSQAGPFSIFSLSNYSNTVNSNKNREYIVKPERIARLNSGEAYIMSMVRKQLAHIQLMV